MSTIFISFYNAYPVTSGSSYITSNLFELWPDTKKSLFLLTHEKNNKLKSNIFTYYVSSIHSLIKIINLPFYFFFILKNINISKKINIFFEGASWTGFTFIFFIILKLVNLINSSIKVFSNWTVVLPSKTDSVAFLDPK